MHQSFRFLLESDGFKIKSLLYAFQRLDFMCFMLCSFINTGHAHYWLVIIAVKIEQIFVISASGLVSQV